MSLRQPLKFTSCMAPNMHFIVRSIAAYVQQRWDIPTEFVDDRPWQDCEAALDRGEIQVGWICGLPYVWKADRLNPGIENPMIELLAAPVMAGERYGDRPVYFSDVVVRQDSPYQQFADLYGKVWACNEPRSHSGCYVTRYYLAKQGLPTSEYPSFFRQTIDSGAHQISLQMVLEGSVDASAIDSTVLEQELQRSPQLRAHIRIIETLGPSPIPPWVISTTLPQSQRQEIRQLLLQMQHDPEGQAILWHGSIARFTTVSDRDYDPIREMMQLAEQVEFA